MTVPRLVGTDVGGPADAPVLLLGPSLGTSADTLWSRAAQHLRAHLRVVAFDLPGHGRSPVGAPVTIADLAAGVLALADRLGADTFHYAGDSVGGCIGLQLLLDAPDRVRTATLLCTGASIGDAAGWRERAATVRAEGTTALLGGAVQRWFAPGFADRQPERAAALLAALRDTDAEGYAQVCDALAAFDVTARLPEIGAPVLAVAGAADVPTPPESLARIASGVRNRGLEVLDGVGHLAPAEAPTRVAELIAAHCGIPGGRPTTTDAVHDAGLAVRRAVLGDAHVDRAIAATTDLTADFQRMITEYAWGTIWTRPGLDRRSRSLITLTALVARGHHEELAMHLRAARRNGVTLDEIKELLMQTAIYCGVPDANTAFRIATRVLEEEQ
ncbi:3-oxoadipate enol-lactonase [Mycolicibacterium madagascariense]|uniref:3-oxoadipate enol-lactonase n=1 Tax=Mycolicibacterium madagascariense TaxID=212765 RepID=A0A7I7XAT1_9MYCO|nr:4-carboxymuconolactone decarboxylase [Mycolicibacterium madagascariense]MCV7010814.1 4-carboxymuconolactone decarboxylase [Mycolicibacterium madagascariense]BBZ26053.1 3-oxoadipate enol-lactonase [Mycolicibacterium madagascariense]